MTHRFAFVILKALEIYSFRHLTDNKPNDYSLVYVSKSLYGNYTLIIGGDWIYGIRRKQVLEDLHEILDKSWKETDTPPMFSIVIEKENIGNSDIDSLIRISKSYDGFDIRYFIPTTAIPLESGGYEEGYILKSKLLPYFEFRKELLVLVRGKKEWQKLVPIGFTDENVLVFLNDQGTALFKENPLKEIDISGNSENVFYVNIFDVFEIKTADESFEQYLVA